MKTATAAFQRDVRMACCDELARRGFARYRRDGADWPLQQSGFHLWVGLNTGLYNDKVVMSLFWGLHVVPLEKLLSKLKGGVVRYDRGVATYSVNSAEIVPHRPLEFFPNRNNDATISYLANLCVVHGIPFAETISSYEALLPLVRARQERFGGYPQTVTAMLFLMGKPEEAKSYIKKFVNDHKDNAHILGDFKNAFFAMLEGDG